ncbi:hypothetical protein NE237_005049 [Protea cynaroides]|uniref:Uncharacterized protein n=1 Tax=Protea cynaroides TaxID=273540 RepID=A0A9Q0QTX1_9MAGN|nr:hypothetical protein NE237_005049 [Protea cynaroides]
MFLASGCVPSVLSEKAPGCGKGYGRGSGGGVNVQLGLVSESANVEHYRFDAGRVVARNNGDIAARLQQRSSLLLGGMVPINLMLMDSTRVVVDRHSEFGIPQRSPESGSQVLVGGAIPVGNLVMVTEDLGKFLGFPSEGTSAAKDGNPIDRPNLAEMGDHIRSKRTRRRRWSAKEKRKGKSGFEPSAV